MKILIGSNATLKKILQKFLLLFHNNIRHESVCSRGIGECEYAGLWFALFRLRAPATLAASTIAT